jgi:hypothetical protein
MERSWCALLGAALLLSLPLQAERYALLAGISNYQASGINLEGPQFDVKALAGLLVERHGYRAANVTILLDQQATRENIVSALRAAVNRLRAGDDLLFYFSGHGASAFDRNMQQLSPEIGPDSGALAPYNLDLTSLTAAVGTLIIGRRDLRPILSRVPAGAQALVVLDACYSENSVKAAGVLATAPVRGVNLAARLRDQNAQAGSALEAPAAPASENEPYPYTNVVAFAAASKNQAALDIGSALLSQNWHTVDGKPHGALTNSLLAGLEGAADTNHDGTITYDELFRFIRRDMEKLPHQPQMLAPADFPEKRAFVTPGAALPGAIAGPGSSPDSPPPSAVLPTSAALTGMTVSLGTVAASPPPRVRVQVENGSAALLSALAALPEVEVVAGAYDLLLRAAGKEWEIYDVSGVLVQSLRVDDVRAVAARVGAEGRLAELRKWSSPKQSFNVKIDVEPEAGDGYQRLRSVLRVGENAKFRIGSERPAYLLLLDIDKQGRVSVLYPGPDPGERARQPRPVEFVARITLPAGSDELKLIGFALAPPDWAQWACTATTCPEFGSDDPRMGRLLQMLRTSDGTAETSLRVITQQ